MSRTRRFHARANETEWRALLAIARQDALNPSEALRTIVRQEAQRRGLWPMLVTTQRHKQEGKSPKTPPQTVGM